MSKEAMKQLDALISKYSDKLHDSVGPHDAAKFEEDCNHIRQTLAEQPAPVQGWKLVPVEPTQKMLDAPPNAYPADALVTWKAMLAAAPQPAVQQEPAWRTAGGIPRFKPAQQEPVATPMSQPNRVIAYAAASKLRELGYEWVDEAWKQPAQQEPDAFVQREAIRTLSGGANHVPATLTLNDDGGKAVAVFLSPQPAQHPDSSRIDWLTNNPVDALDIFGHVKGADAVRWIRQEIDDAIASKEIKK